MEDVPCCWPNADVVLELCAPKADGCPKADVFDAPNGELDSGAWFTTGLLGASVPRLFLLAASKAPLMSLRALVKNCSAFANPFCSY